MKTGQIDTATSVATAVATSINSSKEANAPLVKHEPVDQPLPRAGDHAAVTLRSPSSTVLNSFSCFPQPTQSPRKS